MKMVQSAIGGAEALPMFGQRCRWMFATDRPPSRRAQKADGAGLLVSAHMLPHTLEPNEHRELDLGGARPRATKVVVLLHTKSKQKVKGN